MLPDVGLALAGAVMGAMIGSFLATIILRWPKGEQALWGRSHCDSCGCALGPMELVPIVSALWLKGQCRNCTTRIDPLHHRVEIGCAIIGGCALFFVQLPSAICWAGLGWILLTLAILDLRHFWLPDALTGALLLLGLICGPWLSGISHLDSVVGALAGYGALGALAFVYRRLRGREGLGMGDAKLLGALGACYGWQALPFILLLASVGGLLWALLLFVRHRDITAQSRVPLGTFLALAAVPGWAASLWMLSGL